MRALFHQFPFARDPAEIATSSGLPGRLFPFRSTLVLAGNIFHER